MKASDRIDLNGLPGESLIRKGMDDFRSGTDSPEACLVQIIAPKLADCGWELEAVRRCLPEPELHLYALLRASGGDAYSQYNALLRTLSSFGRNLEGRRRHQTAPQPAAKLVKTP